MFSYFSCPRRIAPSPCEPPCCWASESRACPRSSTRDADASSHLWQRVCSGMFSHNPVYSETCPHSLRPPRSHPSSRPPNRASLPRAQLVLLAPARASHRHHLRLPQSSANPSGADFFKASGVSPSSPSLPLVAQSTTSPSRTGTRAPSSPSTQRRRTLSSSARDGAPRAC
jgi:hypothetical protein